MKFIYLFFYVLLLSSCNLDDNSYIDKVKKTKIYSNDIQMDIEARDLEGLIVKALKECTSSEQRFLLNKIRVYKNDLNWSITKISSDKQIITAQYKDYITTIPTRKKGIFFNEILFNIDDIKMIRKDKEIDFKYLISRGDERYGGLYRVRKLNAQIRVFESYKNMAGEKYKKLYLMEFINYCNMFLVTQHDEDIINNRERAIKELKKLEK
ncbi:MAG: hypothetical protein ACRDBY_03655 [Cetobacterium sp.]|uniref:hypothetical protein n=1 Tax=Cetobacterium sp. TaxID=2071632 RepID=UPI003EE765B8